MTVLDTSRDPFADTLRAQTQLDAPAPALSTGTHPQAPHIATRHAGKGLYLCDNGHRLQLTRHVMGQGCFGKVVSALWVRPPDAQGVSQACVVAVKKPKRSRFCPPMVDARGVLHLPSKNTPAFAKAAQLCVDNLESEARGAHRQQAALAPLAVLRTRGKALLVLPHMGTTLQAFSADLPAALAEPLAWHLLPQLLAQLEVAATHGANGDIKAGNTLMRGHRVAFCDFGWATDDETQGYTTGAQRFRAPEAFVPGLRVPGALAKADVYSLGLMILITATGNFGRALEKLLARAVRSDRTLSEGLDSAAAVQAMGAWIAGAPPTAAPCHAPEERHLRRVLDLCFKRVSPALGTLLRRMLDPNPRTRLSAGEALAAVGTCGPRPMPAELSTKLDDHARQPALAVSKALKRLG